MRYLSLAQALVIAGAAEGIDARPLAPAVRIAVGEAAAHVAPMPPDYK